MSQLSIQTLTKNLVTFERQDAVKDEILNIFGVHWKIRLLGGIRDCLKRWVGGGFDSLQRFWGEGVDTPMHTMGRSFSKKSFYPSRPFPIFLMYYLEEQST